MNDGMKLCGSVYFFLLSLPYFLFLFYTCFYYGTGLGLFRDIPYIHSFSVFKLVDHESSHEV